jgi:hypothetical protein
MKSSLPLPLEVQYIFSSDVTTLENSSRQLQEIEEEEIAMTSQENNQPYIFRADADAVHNDYPDIVTSNDQLDIEGFDRFMYQGNQNNNNNEIASHAHEIANNNDNDNFSDVFSSSDISISSSPSMPSFPSYSSPDRGIRRCRSLVSSSWNERFQELIQFREAYDHCFVPHDYPDNPRLSQWVRKQRHQRKRKERGLHSTLNDERQEMLTNAGFIWDSHQAQWQERYQSLEVFQLTHGHCNVPSNYRDSSLSNWVKNQRKQYKLYLAEQKTTMNEERVNLLNSRGFNWNPRNLGGDL